MISPIAHLHVFQMSSYLSSLSPILTLLLYISVLSVLYISYSSFISPLRNIPGPFFARHTSLWLVHITRQRNRHLHDINLHKTYGPIVRVGPSQISLSNPSAVKMVYGVSFKRARGCELGQVADLDIIGSITKPLEKSNWYSTFSRTTSSLSIVWNNTKSFKSGNKYVKIN